VYLKSAIILRCRGANRTDPMLHVGQRNRPAGCNALWLKSQKECAASSAADAFRVWAE